ncbi:MAG: fibrobacter succinogenes major paralogous domain-containing protein [Rikenellaceae bacterium]|nr:fibrobacter succinogenes major paralogous domain-containing protein [Rikenellaceae bacterium]MDE7355181.1 fibrobacter succinogenes major paralogous domain-containing protein [Rikenellaceae bacterium]
MKPSIQHPEFPAVGWRDDDSSGTLNVAGVWGNYWSSVAYYSDSACNLYFSSGVLTVGNGDYKRRGLSVRCVRQ